MTVTVNITNRGHTSVILKQENKHKDGTVSTIFNETLAQKILKPGTHTDITLWDTNRWIIEELPT